MISLGLCLVAFAMSVFYGRRSLSAGVASVLAVGYLYGIARANVPGIFAHFMFDFAVLGLYVAQAGVLLARTERFDLTVVRLWVMALVGLPLVLLLMPWQDPVIQLVGFRGNAFLLPFLVIGSTLNGQEAGRLAGVMAFLNVVTLTVAGAEYFLGVDWFIPHVAGVTDLIYRGTLYSDSSDLRIPATFVNAHAYGGTMLMTLPWILGAWVQKQTPMWRRRVLVSGVGACLLGIFLSGARIHFLVLVLLVVFATVLLMRQPQAVRRRCLPVWLLLVVFIVGVVASQERLQRFTLLEDTQGASERIAGSVNMGFWEAISTYPFGNGLGGGGTSIPYFWQDRINDFVRLENEYARIVLEEGVPGLGLWCGFIVWLASRGSRRQDEPWYLARQLLLVCCLAFFASGLIGVGLLTSVPQTCILLLSAGWVAVRQVGGEVETRSARTVLAQRWQRRSWLGH